MHAVIISGGNTQERAQSIRSKISSLSINPEDIITVSRQEEAHIGISHIRELKHRTMLAPFNSPFTACIVENAHTMTVQAQNALLKILEEPPAHTIFFLETDSYDSLLPTIRSRCEHQILKSIHTTQENDAEYKQSLNEILNASIGKRISLINAIAKDREHASAFLHYCVITLHTAFLNAIESAPSSPNTITILGELIARCNTGIGRLEVNINPKLVLDSVFIPAERFTLDATAQQT